MSATETRTLTIPHPAETSDAASAPVDITRVRDLLDGLDRRQRQAVAHGDGPLLVVAGPGTGKTEVITRRVAWLIASRRARASEILALTFTEKAADEMQARIDLLVPYGQVETAIHTFHAFGDWLLREHGHAIGRSDDPRVIGRSGAMVLLRDNIFDLGLERYLPLGDPTRFVGALADLFARAKEEGVTADDLADYARTLRAGVEAAAADSESSATDAIDGLLDEAEAHAELARAYAAYQALLMEHSLMDHGDQVAEAVRLLDERPAARLAMRRRFRYVVVDEAQDANPQQLRLVRHLAGAGGNVTFVGDDDQAIYSFRGAVGQGLIGLEDDYDDLRHVVLGRNYRSRKPILEAARRLIRHNDPERLEVIRGLDKTLTAVRRSRRPAPVTHHVYRTASDEADAVAGSIRERLANGAEAGSIAILVRANADAAPVLASLDVLGVPRRFSGASGLLRHREVRDVLALLRVLESPSSSEDLYAVMTAAPYGLHGEDLTAICELASRRRRSLWSVVAELVEQPGLLRLSQDSRDRLKRIVAHLRVSLSDAHERNTPAVLYDHLRASGWLRSLIAAAERGDDGPLRRVARLFEMVKDQSELVGDDRVATVVPILRGLLDAGVDPAAPREDELEGAVSVLTVHQAKGLEFSSVYVVGAAEGRFPIRARRDPLSLPEALTGHKPTGDPDAQRAEERRLFYVALTRARDELHISHAVLAREGGRTRRVSTFVSEALGTAAEETPATTELGLSVTEQLPPVAAPVTARATQPSLTLSFSQIDDYLTCPLKYYLRHEVRVPTAPHHALVLGNALHQAVATVNMARRDGREIDADQAASTLEAHWRSEGFLSPEHEAARFAAGQTALERFVAESGSASDRILAVEQSFAVRIGDNRVRGRYDAVRQTDEGVVVTDYKSGDMRDPVRAGQRARSSLQLQLYALAWQAEHGELPGSVELHFLEGDVVGRAAPSEKQLERARGKVETVAAGIRAGKFDATPGYPACDWCPYKRVCAAAP